MDDAEAMDFEIVLLFENHHVDNCAPSKEGVPVLDGIGENSGI